MQVGCPRRTVAGGLGLLYLHCCQVVLVQQKGKAMAGKFELYKDAGGKFRFRLRAGNGQVIAVGEAYESKAAAMNGIESVKSSAAGAAVDDQTD